jgi:hypothetical protein
VSQRHRGVVAGLGKKRIGGHDLDAAFPQESERPDNPQESCRETCVAQEPADEEAEERRIQSRQAAVNRKVRLPQPDSRRDEESGKRQRQSGGGSRPSFAHRAEQAPHRYVPDNVVGAEVGEMAGRQPPPRPGGNRVALKLQRGRHRGGRYRDRRCDERARAGDDREG